MVEYTVENEPAVVFAALFDKSFKRGHPTKCFVNTPIIGNVVLMVTFCRENGRQVYGVSPKFFNVIKMRGNAVEAPASVGGPKGFRTLR
jgi:hypothetical protein